MLLPLLLAGVEFVEAVSDNGNGERDDQDTEYRTEATENLSKSCDWRHVPIANLNIHMRWNLLIFFSNFN